MLYVFSTVMTAQPAGLPQPLLNQEPSSLAVWEMCVQCQDRAGIMERTVTPEVHSSRMANFGLW